MFNSTDKSINCFLRLSLFSLMVFTQSICAQDLQRKVLFAGELGDQWLDLSTSGGDYSKFAQIKDKALVVDVPAGNSWGKTGIRSAEPLFNIPSHDEELAIKLTFDINLAQSSDFVFAVIPSNWDGVKEWRSHLVRLQVNKNADETADLSLRIKTKELMRAKVDFQLLNQIHITIRPDKVVLVADKNDNIILQGLMNTYAEIYPAGYKVSALTHAKEADLTAKLMLNRISIEPVPVKLQPDYSKISSELGQTVLFDGEILGSTWQSHVNAKVAFDDVAKIRDGSLIVDVPAESAHANVGIQSVNPVFWLDHFGVASKRELIFDFVPELTSGFVISVANKRQYFMVKWFENTAAEDSVIQLYLKNSLSPKGSPDWEQHLTAKSPEQIKLLMTPLGITLTVDNQVKHTQAWDRLFPYAGYTINVFSSPKQSNQPVKMALKQIALNNINLAVNEVVRPEFGVNNPPVVELFGDSSSDDWHTELWPTTEKSTYKCAYVASAFEALDTDNKAPNTACGINHKDKIIKLDERIENANYQITLQFDPKSFSIAWSHQREWRNWDYCEFSLLQNEHGEDIVNLRCPGVIQRTVDSDWLNSSWDGKVNLLFSKEYIQVGLNNGTTILYNSSPSKSQYLYVRTPHHWHKHTSKQLKLIKITGQWLPIEPINSVERWMFLDKADFDPELFIKDLVNDLPFPNAEVTAGDDDEK